MFKNRRNSNQETSCYHFQKKSYNYTKFILWSYQGGFGPLNENPHTSFYHFSWHIQEMSE